MTHIVLLGDSIFDNHAYVQRGEPAVIDQLRAHMPAGWRATLLAVDGDVTADVARQLEDVPADATHLVVSVGGNDALGVLDLLNASAQSMADALMRLAAVGEGFEQRYRSMLDTVLRHHLPAALCTIYYPAFPEPMLQRLAVTGLTVFNDAILRVAAGAGVPALDLRLICTEPTDYANPIEPSAAGGEKIAQVIATVVREHDFAGGRTTLYRA